MSQVSKLYLCNFTTPHIYETFFKNVCIAKASFYFCPCFHKEFIKGTMLQHCIIYEELNEVICRCLNCSNQIISTTNFRKESDDFFDELKKIMIQYFYVYGRYDNK